MEILDDLMYCLNFHAELLPAEDQLILQNLVMPFLMNVIAALPLDAANVLLALYDAGCISLIKDNVVVLEHQQENGATAIELSNADEKTKQLEYRMFINCSGQSHLKFSDFPFPSLRKKEIVRKARAKFKVEPNASVIAKLKKNGKILFAENEMFLSTGGIDIDAGYQVIKSDGTPDSRIHDLSFVHTAGCRPYSYGLQPCNATSLILVEALKKSNLERPKTKFSIESSTKTYENNANL